MHASGEGDVAEPGREAREVGLGGDGPSEREEVVLDLGPELVRAAAVGERSVRQHRPSRRGGGGATGEGTYVAAPIRRLPSPPPALNPSRSARRLPSHRPHRPGAAPALAAPPPSARTGVHVAAWGEFSGGQEFRVNKLADVQLAYKVGIKKNVHGVQITMNNRPSPDKSSELQVLSYPHSPIHHLKYQSLQFQE
uniref:Uncharacterized protein n=1 Tax=Oryza glumipatula TaxID=40148 RepID=A0A0D9YW52_9ORYZ